MDRYRVHLDELHSLTSPFNEREQHTTIGLGLTEAQARSVVEYATGLRATERKGAA